MKLKVQKKFARRAPKQNVPAAAKERVWKEGEERAAAYLVNHEYKIIDQNWRTRHGELDIIALDSLGDRLVFVEVRTLRTCRYTKPEMTVSYHKQRKLAQLGAAWAQRHQEYRQVPMCFDVIGIVLEDNSLTHLKSAFVVED